MTQTGSGGPQPEGERQGPAGGARGALSRQRIIETALALLDEQGLEGFSMRRLAARLGVGAMSLYRYFASKDELFSELVGVLFEHPVPEAEPGASWRERLESLASSFRELLLTHPNAMPLLFSHGGVPLRGRPATEAMLEALRRAGLADADVGDAWRALGAYLVGYVTVERLVRRQRSALSARSAPQRDFPALAAVIPHLKDSWDAQFAASLEVVLDGVAIMADKGGKGAGGVRASGTRGDRSAR